MSGENEELKKFLREKQEREEKLYRRSVQHLYDALEGSDREVFFGYASQGLLSEMEIIFRYYKMPPVTVPPHVPEEQKLQELLERSGIMSRPVTLRKGWWKNDSMPLFCMGQDGNYHAVVPGVFGGMYYYNTQTGSK